MHVCMHMYIHVCTHTHLRTSNALPRVSCRLSWHFSFRADSCCRTCVWHDSLMTGLIHHKTRSFVWHDSFIRATWLVHSCDMTRSFVWHDSYIFVPRLIREGRFHVAVPVCDMTPSCQDSFMTRLIHSCDMTHWFVWRDSLICVTWLIDLCDMTHWFVW